MTLSLQASTDIPAAQAACWDSLLDVDALLAASSHNSLQVERIDGDGTPKVGSAWKVSLDFAGRRHNGTITVAELRAPDLCLLSGQTEQLRLALRFELHAIAEARTQMDTAVTVAARSLPGRFLLKPMSLMTPMLQARFQQRVDWLASRMIARQQAG